MKGLKSFKLQVLAGFVAVISVTVAALLLAYMVDRRISDEREETVGALLDRELIASRIDLAAERMVAASRGYLLTGDVALLESVEKSEDEVADSIRIIESPTGAPELRARLDPLRKALAAYRAAFDRLSGQAAAMPSRAAVAQAVEDRLMPRRTDLSRRVDELNGYIERLIAEQHVSARAFATRQLRILTAIGAAGIVFALGLAWSAARHLNMVFKSEETARRDAQRAVQARDELLAVVAHDLRSPLSAVLIKAALIRRGASDAKVRGTAESIERVASRMECLIQSLLDAASIEAGRFSISRDRCEVEPVLSATLEMFEAPAAHKSIVLNEEHVRPDLAIWADRERIIEVLSNLVSNALKFTPEGGHIDLCVHQADAYVRFEVRDTGRGIAPEQVPLVFNRYWKGEPGGRKGSGLGLYIAKGIVEAHGGRIWVEAEPGRGSAFFFEIPTFPSEVVVGQRPEARAHEHPVQAS